jgi:hypothetical protein
VLILADWRLMFGLGCGVLAACGNASKQGMLVGNYDVTGVLVENSCGQSGLPAANPLRFKVEIRQDQSVGYWNPNNQLPNAGTLNASGVFKFTTTQSKVLQDATLRQLNPGDFTNPGTDPDLPQKRTCVLTITQTVAGTITRRDDAAGAAISVTAADGGAAVSGMDLSADNTIDVQPSPGSDCTTQLIMLGGTYNTLPCGAHYVLTGTLLPSPTNTASATSTNAGGAAR